MADRLKEVTRWMRANFGRSYLAPFTGQDYRAFALFVAALDLYCAADGDGRRAALVALDAGLSAAQASVGVLFVCAVPYFVEGGEGVLLIKRLEDEQRRRQEHGWRTELRHVRCAECGSTVIEAC